MHIGIGGIIHEYKQDLGIYFDNVRGCVSNNHLFFFVDPSKSVPLLWIFPPFSLTFCNEYFPLHFSLSAFEM